MATIRTVSGRIGITPTKADYLPAEFGADAAVMPTRFTGEGLVLEVATDARFEFGRFHRRPRALCLRPDRGPDDLDPL